MNNEVGIGNGIKESGIDRKDIFIVTKLWNDDHGYDNTIEAFNKSLNRPTSRLHRFIFNTLAK